MITYDELKKLAALAKLSLDNEDADALIRDISRILDFADAVAEAAVDLADEAPEDDGWRFRADVLEPSYPAGEILSNAGEQTDGFFVARDKGGVFG
jgi:aspartyl-tRNA(Asn)/glutamyl-tRNA(Gln) amidotransferase subunit C